MAEISTLAHFAAGAAAAGAGLVNAIAGGGTLISFPVLTAIGVPGIRANATNSVALLPGYLGGVTAQRHDLVGLGRRVRPQLVAAALGGLCGSILLIVTSETVFRQIVPFLILAACALLAGQDWLRAKLFGSGTEHTEHAIAQVLSIAAASTYGGYFGAGLGIMLLAILGLFSTLTLNRLNAVKQLLSVVTSAASVALLTFSGRVEWSLVAVMAPASLIGGNLGGRLASRLAPKRLRAGVIAFGVVVALIYLSRL